MKTKIPTEQEYNAAEYARAKSEWRRIEADPNTESALEWFMSHPDGLLLLEKRIVWILEGCYGRGQQIMAINEAVRIFDSRKNSKAAALLFIFAVFECRTTAKEASRIYAQTLSPYGREFVDAAILRAINSIKNDPDRSDLLTYVYVKSTP